MSVERGGIMCSVGSHEIYLDPKSGVGGRTTFVSHAHIDHLPPSGTCAIASEETHQLAALRGIHLEKEDAGNLTLVDSGHILGSRGILVGDVFYTGDICTRDRAFMQRAHVPRCTTLITESTFGKPGFSFPDLSDTVSRTNAIISNAFDRGLPVVLMGYELGKAQILTHLFRIWDPLYVHDSVKVMNDAYRRMGINLRNVPGHTESAHKLGAGPWLMITPNLRAKDPLLSELRSKYGAVVVGFSGWSGSGHTPWRSSADHVIPMSDHCDFEELVSMVRSSGAKTVYTTHGFADEFSSHLRSIGIDAHPLSKS